MFIENLVRAQLWADVMWLDWFHGS
jgi:hypothetical protein